jgi:putative inorganic carbon (HCO3(-)) transporter
MVVVLAFAIADPFIALLAYMWYGLFRPEAWLWADLSALRLSFVLGLILVVRCLTAGVLPNLSHRISWGIFLFLITGLVGQIHAVSQVTGWYWLRFFSNLSLVCLLLISLVNTRSRLFYTVLVTSVSFGVITSNAGLRSLMSGGVRFAVGPDGAFADNNGYALAAVMITPLLLASADTVPADWKRRKWITWALRGAALATTYLVVSTFSRGGFLALGAAALVYYLLIVRKKGIVLAAVAVAILAIAPFVTLPTGYTERLNTIVTYQDVGEESAISRLHFWRVALDMARDQPLGVGLKNFEFNFDKYDFLDGRYGRGRAVHNSHLQALTENGYFGFAVWIGLFVTAISICLRWRRIATRTLAGTEDGQFLWRMAGALVASMAAFIVGGTFIALSINDLTWLTFAIVAALDRVGTKTISNRRRATDPAVVSDMYKVVTPRGAYHVKRS